MNHPRTLLPSLLTLVAVVLGGCSGSSDSSTMTSPRVVIDWPKLTKGIQAPSYANSAVISILPTSALSATTWTVDRPFGTAPQTFTYSGPKILYTVPSALTVTFKSGTGGTGSTVASASVTVKVLADGTIQKVDGSTLGTISYATSLTSLQINVKAMAVNSSQVVSVSGINSEGIVALPQELVNLSIVEKPETVTLDGRTLTGVSEGLPKIQATFDSITSTMAFLVTPEAASYSRTSVKANKVALDSIHKKLWLTCGTDGTYPNSIVDFDLTTRAMGTPIPVGSEPSEISVSADGTVAYVGTNGSSGIRIVDLVSRTAGTTISFVNLYPSCRAIDIQVNPFNRDEVAVCIEDTLYGNPMGPFIYRNGILLNDVSNSNDFKEGAVSWTGATTVVALVNHVTSGALYRFEVTADTVQMLNKSTESFMSTGKLALAGDNVYLNSGDIYSSGTLTAVGRFGPEQQTYSYDRVVTDINGNRVWAIWSGPEIGIIRCFDLPSNTYSTGRVIPLNFFRSEVLSDALRFGDTGFAVLTSEGLYLLNNAPGL